MFFPRYSKRRCQDGFALIVVVLSLTLITVLTIFFLSDVGRERRGVDQYSRGGDSRHLSDTAVNLVMAQINAATKEGTADTPVSWASQPGMIRTYNTDGNLSNAYKLYSWDNLVEGSAVFDPNNAAELPDSTWSQRPSQFTDLNSPVNGVYPIADPTIANAISDPLTDHSSTGTPLVSGSTVPSWDFPQAFSVATRAKGYYASTNKLPMPVKWLYILQDGTWVTPASATATTATMTGPSGSNPIVGRVAFWTDDETSKVNINTASEGSYWDTPKAATQDELQFAANPPSRGEYQRVLGHPATTSLSAVFPEMRGGSFSRWAATGNAPSTNYVQQMQDVFSLAPRIAWGGSQAGTYPINSYNQTYPPPTTTSYTSTSVTNDTDRLYATADDLWFQPLNAGSARAANAVFGNATNASGVASPITAPQMAKRLFLFTSSSRAPETTLMETPRISLWPVTWPYAGKAYYNSISTMGGSGVRTTPAAQTITPNPANIATNPSMTYQEQLLAFDSTLNQSATLPSPYYFQRQNPDSPVHDWSSIQRNQDLVGYLSREMHATPPGMGQNLSLFSKFGSSTDWIALNCFDFSRSLINQYTYNQAASTTTDYLYTYTGLQLSAGAINGAVKTNFVEPNAYAVAPMHVSINGVNYTSEGAFPSLKEVNLVFYATQRLEPALKSGVSATTANTDNPTKWDNLINFTPPGTAGALGTGKSRTTQMQAVLLLSFAGMNPGVWSFRGQTYFAPVFWVKVSQATNAGSFQVNDASINFPTANGSAVQYSAYHPYQSATANYMSPVVASLVAQGGSFAKQTKTFDNTKTGYQYWPLVSDLITVLPDDAYFKFKGAAIQVDIYACLNGDITADPTANNAHPELLISSQQINFGDWDSAQTRYPSQLLPIPLAPRWNIRQATSVTRPNLFPGTGAGYDPNDPSVAGWATELVPSLRLLTEMVPNRPQTATNYYDPRVASSSYVADPASGSASEPLIYAYKCVDPTDATRTIPISTSFAGRVDANRRTLTYIAEGNAGAVLFGGSQPQTPAQAYPLVTPYDTAISMVADPREPAAADPRLLGRGVHTSANESGSTSFVRIDVAANSLANNSSAPLANVVNKPLKVVADYGNQVTGINGLMFARSTSQQQYHTLSTVPGVRLPTGYFLSHLFSDGATAPPTYSYLATRGLYTQSSGTGAAGYLLGRDQWDAVVGIDTNVTNIISSNWDWTTLPGNFADGGYIARPDQDYQIMSTGGINGLRVPYFNDAGLQSSNGGGNLSLNVFVPNRQVPSPVILGTLPSSMTTGWQTLTFSPNPALTINGTGGSTHPGVGTPVASNTATGPAYTKLPDHLLLDLFWMPVAEPYPISDQLSTAGKVNLNYAMMPFPYIQRKTGLDAVLKSVWLTALPTPTTNTGLTTFAQLYKSYSLLYQNTRQDATRTRFPINVDATLTAFDNKFSQGDIFRSASQVCDMFLYPNSPTTPNTAQDAVTDPAGSTSNIKTWWKGKRLTADNAREDPYSAIYSRITTKSNSFTVHWKVQSLRKRAGSDQTTWTENQDAVVSELRGSTLIERYVDPNATDLPDYATKSNSTPLSWYYKWRVVSENYFRP